LGSVTPAPPRLRLDEWGESALLRRVPEPDRRAVERPGIARRLVSSGGA
jgi:hypothetical protein